MASAMRLGTGGTGMVLIAGTAGEQLAPILKSSWIARLGQFNGCKSSRMGARRRMLC